MSAVDPTRTPDVRIKFQQGLKIEACRMRWLHRAIPDGWGLSKLIRKRALLFCTVATMIFLSILAANTAWTGPSTWRALQLPEEPIYCDWFMFLRQAKLFQQNGLIAGLDTAIRDPATRYLIEKAKNLPGSEIALEHIGPYCHSYRASTDRLSLNAPPGTGLALSLFPEGRQARLSFVANVAIVFLMLTAAALTARRWTVPLIAAALGLTCFLG